MTERPGYEEAVRRTDVLGILAPFDPHVVGTLPLGVARPDSNIDIVCCAVDQSATATLLWEHFREADGFALYQWSAKGRPLIARFKAHGWPFEIFASVDPVSEQPGWQHFEVERRLLELGDTALRAAILALRIAGEKTEPAFATVLGLPGDPYRAMSELFRASDDGLNELLTKSGFKSG
jgi:hypothetical protein